MLLPPILYHPKIMHWWQGAFMSKSQSADDSAIPTTRPGFFSSRRNRLLRKLRQATETDADVLRSPGQSQNVSARSSVSAPPQPLPLPELRVLLQNDPKLAASSGVPLPSPEVHREREMTEAAMGEAMDGHKSRIDSGTYSERCENIRSTRRSPHTKKKSLDSYNMNMNMNTNMNMNMNAPISAPTSPYSSMILSPPLNDVWATQYMNPPPGIFQVWSAPEMATSPPRSTSPLPSTDTLHPLPLPPTFSLSSPNSDFSTPSPVGTKPELKPIKSQWQKGKLIGRGTFGSVYVASNRETGALCAMKEVEILQDDSKSAECMRQLEQEIKVLSQLKHPNIVQYYGSEIVGDKFYIYLEYVHPGSINKFIQDHCAAITESVVRNFSRHILCGLAYLHSKKTIHRDIKGANLLVDAYGVVKLADFGMAKHLNGQTTNLSLKGSPYWMAPELLQSALQTDNSSDAALAVDIWSLGCTIIEMMNGKPPWSEYEGAAALFKVLKETPPIPTTMSAEGKDFLQCCFRRNPAERPTAAMLLNHPFLSYSQQPDPLLKEMKLSDNSQFIKERPRHKQDQAHRAFDTQMKKLSNSYNFMHDSFSPVRVANEAISKHPPPTTFGNWSQYSPGDTAELQNNYVKPEQHIKFNSVAMEFTSRD